MDYSSLQNSSDIRGVAMEGVAGQEVNLTEQACRDIGRGFALWLRERLGKDDLRVAVGRDSRLTGPALARWIGEALAAEGVAATVHPARHIVYPMHPFDLEWYLLDLLNNGEIPPLITNLRQG